MKPTAWYDPTNGAVSTDKDSPLFTPLGQLLPLYTQRTEPPAWFPAVENILNEYGLQAIDFVADFKAAMKDAEQPQRTWVGLDWLPEHKCGLHLSHNEHRDVYEKIEEFYDSEDFISPEEWRKAVAEDSVWVLHWYPNTPIGFIRIAASTLEAIEAEIRG